MIKETETGNKDNFYQGIKDEKNKTLEYYSEVINNKFLSLNRKIMLRFIIDFKFDIEVFLRGIEE
jgi:hypothetical protein